MFFEIDVPSSGGLDRALISTEDDDVIAFIIYHWPEKKMTNVWTAPEHRGKGQLSGLITEAQVRHPGGWTSYCRIPEAYVPMMTLHGVAVDDGPRLDDTHTGANYAVADGFGAFLRGELQTAWRGGATTY